MKFDPYASLKSHYVQLKDINGISFTEREIDVIAGVISGKGANTIADLLNISPKTIDTHLRNIFLKIGTNCKEKVIDYVEQTDSFDIFYSHYKDLSLLRYFFKQLKKIEKLLKQEKVICYIKIIDEENISLKRIFPDLNKIGLITVDERTFNVEGLNEKGPGIIICNKQADYSTNALTNKKIIFLEEQESYFHLIFLILGEVLKNFNINSYLGDFQKQYDSLYNPKIDKNFEVKKIPSSSLSQIIEKSDDKKNLAIQFFERKGFYHKFFFAILLLAFLILSTTSPLKIFKVFFDYKYVFTCSTIPSENDVLKLKQILSNGELKSLSAANITSEQIRKNHELIKQIENIKWFLNDDVITYFSHAEIPSTQLIDFLVLLHALSNYYNYNEHNGIKAREILLYAKTLAEEFVNSRNTVKVNFNDLTGEEIYTELSIIQYLPEIYTRILYLLGRTYIYQDEGDINKGKYYFEMAAYLGERLKLFDGILSKKSGIAVIYSKLIKEYYEKNNIDQAIHKIKEIIRLNKLVKEDSTEYITEFDPYTKSPIIVIPSQDKYNLLDCSEKIVNAYAQLIALDNVLTNKLFYFEEIKLQIIGNHDNKGILDILPSITLKKTASVYNTLGDTLLVLYDHKSNYLELLNTIKSKLNIPQNLLVLDSIEQIYNLAKINSRSSDFTKADAYEGLASVLQRKLQEPSFQSELHLEALKKITHYKKERDRINTKLNRDPPLKLMHFISSN